MTEWAVTYLFFNVRSLIWCCSGQDARVTEAGLQQGDDHKYKEGSSNDRYAAGQVFHQEGTAVDTERYISIHLFGTSYQEMFRLAICCTVPKLLFLAHDHRHEIIF